MDFNPHSREGSDVSFRLVSSFSTISIHTPAKGVTYIVFRIVRGTNDFNPHSREGSDREI